MKMKSKTKRAICRLLSTLAVLTILCQIPAGAAALEDITQIATQQITATENATLLKAEDLPANIQNLLLANRQNHSVYLAATEKVDGAYETAELYTLRTEDPLTGTGTLTVHSSPIKYIDDNGDLQFIDTAVKPITTAQRSAAGYAYRNAANSFSVEYGSAATTGINFDNAFTFAVKETAAARKTQAISKTDTDKVLYADAFGANTAVEYVNIENGIKENIILSKYTGQTRFDFIFRSETHVPILAEDGMVIWIAKKRTPKEPEYRFLDLYAYDSYDPAIHGVNKGSNFRHLNEELYYELATNTDGSYTITVVVPEEYLAHPEIVYPVTIDPSITPHTSANSNTHDTFVDAATPTTQTSYNLSYVRFGKVNGYKNFGYHRFANMPSLPDGANITSAKLKFTFRSGQNTPSASSGISMWTPKVTAYQWNETTITWNNQPYGDSGPLTNITYNGSYLDYFNADLTDEVCGWYADPSSNYGIDFTYSNEEYNDYNSVVSAEGDSARAPTLTIDYELTGLASGQIYYLRNANSGKYLDVPNSNSDNGTDLVQYSFNGNTNQQFKVVYNKTTLDYSLYPVCAPNSAIEITNASADNNEIVQIWARPSASVMDSQRFRIKKNNDGTYNILSYSSNYTKAVVVQNASVNNSAAIIQHTSNGTSNGKWYFETRASKGKINHSGNLFIGISSDNYLNNTCGFGSRVSSQCADYFAQFLGGMGYNNVSFSLLFNRKNEDASKSDFLSKAYHPNSNANIDDVHFMLFVGHGRAEQGLHFTNGIAHGNNHNDSSINLPRSEASFGYGNAKTKWVAAYTCNFLTGDTASVSSVLKGANIVLGYGSVSYLVRNQMGEFAQDLKPGGNIIDSWFDAGTYHTQYGDNAGILKAVFVADARNDTLYQYLKAAGGYGIEEIKILTRTYPPRNS